MKKHLLLFLTLTLFTFQVSHSQTVDDLNKQSKTLLESGKYEEAEPILRKAAGLGSGEAQYNLGYLLQSGVLGEKKPKEAIECFKKSSDNNFNNGHYALMMAYGNGYLSVWVTGNYRIIFHFEQENVHVVDYQDCH